jgi:DNA-binding NarL/FixJ family response regulator
MIKIIAVDDDPKFIEHIKSKFKGDDYYRLVRCFSTFKDKHNVENLLHEIRIINPDIVLMDYSFLEEGKSNHYGLFLTRSILRQDPTQKVIMLVNDNSDPQELRWEKIEDL